MFDKIAICLALFALVTIVRCELSAAEDLPEDSQELDRLIKESEGQIKAYEVELKQLRQSIVRASRPNINIIYQTQDMLADAETIASDALNRYNDPSEISRYIRVEFRKKYTHPNWHCFVGHDLGFDFAKNKNNHIQLEVRGFQIVIFFLNQCNGDMEF